MAQTPPLPFHVPNIKLNDGHTIPVIGFGTGQSQSPSQSLSSLSPSPSSLVLPLLPHLLHANVPRRKGAAGVGY